MGPERAGDAEGVVGVDAVRARRDPGQGSDRVGRVGAVDDLGLEHLGLAHRPEVPAEGLGQAVEQGVELEEVEEALELVAVDLAHLELVEAAGQLLGQVDVAEQLHDDGVLPHDLLVRRQVLLELRRLLVEVGEDAVEVAVLVEQLGGGLLPHAGDAGQVVAGVAPHGGVHDVLVGGDAGALEDAGLVVEGVVRHAALVVEDLDVGVADQLVHVAVAGDDDDVVARLAALLGERGDDVVGLDAGLVHDREAEGGDDLADQAHLLAEDVGGLGPARLVVGDALVAERLLRAVEGHDDAVARVVPEHVDQHRREPVDGVGHLPGGGGHVGGQGEERPVRQRVAVDQEKAATGRGHGRIRLRRRCRG